MHKVVEEFFFFLSCSYKEKTVLYCGVRNVHIALYRVCIYVMIWFKFLESIQRVKCVFLSIEFRCSEEHYLCFFWKKVALR